MSLADLLSVYRGRRVLVTGHTGFKGGWLASWLEALGAEVHGYALPPATQPNLFTAGRLESRVRHAIGDVRDMEAFAEAFRRAQPEIVFHLAAQPLVRESYRDPVATVATNVLGVTHCLELARRPPVPRAVVVVTSDKCYEDQDWHWPYREADRLGGHDPYSASKAAAEIVARAYRASFMGAAGVAVATARAGNVIGGGDWSADRIVPDAIRALSRDEALQIRSPRAVRPWQHVLEPLSGYLTLGARLFEAGPDAALCDAFNFGPDGETARPVEALARAVIEAWGSGRLEVVGTDGLGRETLLLRLATDKARAVLGWRPRWDFARTVTRTVEWYKAHAAGAPADELCRAQIRAYMDEGS